MGFLAWFRRFIPAEPRSVDTAGFSSQRFKDLQNLHVGQVNPADLSVAFRERLMRACVADQNIRGLWINWMTSRHAERELLVVLSLEVQDDESVRTFLQRIHSPDGPRCAAAVTAGTPESAWYRKNAP